LLKLLSIGDRRMNEWMNEYATSVEWY
jgi:hypothetical protein